MYSKAAFLWALALLVGCSRSQVAGTHIILDDKFKKEAADLAPGHPDDTIVPAYKLAQRPFKPQEAQALLGIFGMSGNAKRESTRTLIVFREGSRSLLFNASRSEYQFLDAAVGSLVKDSPALRGQLQPKTDSLVKRLVKEKGGSYKFINAETTFVQMPSKKDPNPVPEYMYGRYVQVMNNRYILGSRSQIRIGLGQGGADGLRFVSDRNPVPADSHPVTVPTRGKVVRDLIRIQGSQKGMKEIFYPFSQQKLAIDTLKLIQTFEAYIRQPEGDGLPESLIPVVTLLAEAKLKPSPNNRDYPFPSQPVILHFTFPCTEVGACWPGEPRPKPKPIGKSNLRD